MNRRQFTALTTAGVAGNLLGTGASATLAEVAATDPWDPDKPLIVTGRPLRVQPILTHALYEPKEKTSWRSWSEIINEPAAEKEMQRIAGDLRDLSAKADFPMELLPTAKVTTADQAANIQRGEFDAILLFAATNGKLFQPCCAAAPQRDTVVFVRHKSGPTYYGYECIGVRYFQVPTPELWRKNSVDNHGPVTLDDVVVDDLEDVLWRLRALYGLKNLVGQRIIALGGAQGKYDSTAPDVARRRFQIKIIEIPYEEFAARLQSVHSDTQLQKRFAAWTDQYLALPHTQLETGKHFIQNAFALYMIFRQWLREHEAPAITINACMGTIISMSETTACMPLSWLNDEGSIALCESDFVIVPAAILLRYISGKPVFMHNSTFPHQGIVTCAHCTAPRRMDGSRYEPARIMTHYESDFGAAPKIEMPIGQQVSAISPEFASGRWVGIKATVQDNPCHAICRSQQDILIQGDWKRLVPETRDSHWIMAYGDYLREAGYAARKLGLVWDNISDTNG
ncbi:MAG: hypothetical protein JW829_14920 [Pirellulales bacterium]|nr:hypothetical protein [Pirellulales bacterium]